MVKEIYIRPENDPNFEPGIVDYTNEIESVISQIKMILGTHKGDVLGSYSFGIDLDYLVFNTRAAAADVSTKIMDAITEYVSHGPNVSITCDVNFGDSGEGYDFAVVDIYINGSKTIGFLVDKS